MMGPTRLHGSYWETEMPRYKEYCLRPIKDNDLTVVLGWRNSDRVRMHMYTDHIITEDEHRRWFERLSHDSTNHCLVFEEAETLLGVVTVSRVDSRNNKCHWGFYIGDPASSRGTGKRMGYLGLEFVFGELQIRKLCGEAFAFNEASLRFHKEFGFREEGRFIQHVWKNGRYEDVIAMALFREDWDEMRDKMAARCFSHER